MYQVYFYRNEKGEEPVVTYMRSLAEKKGKDSRIKLNKIQDYIQILSQYGTGVGEPYMKHISGDIWELRPLRDRIFFAAWMQETFILLHHFTKKTQKTPKREIEKAVKNWEDYKEREGAL